MKKILIGLGVILIMAIIGGFYFYKQVIPKMAAKAIVKGEYSAFVPKKIQNKVNAARGEINNQVEKTLKATSSNGITIDQLYIAIDQVDKTEVETTYKLIMEGEITDPQEAFNIAYSNIEIEVFDPMILKPVYDEIIKKEHIIRVVKTIESNNLLENLDMQMARNVAKQILMQKQEEIKGRTDAIKF
jgi:uncharacterized protein YxeA